MNLLDLLVFPVVAIAAVVVLRKLFEDNPHKGCSGCSGSLKEKQIKTTHLS
jgi:hypothetical protein